MRPSSGEASLVHPIKYLEKQNSTLQQSKASYPTPNSDQTFGNEVPVSEGTRRGAGRTSCSPSPLPTFNEMEVKVRDTGRCCGLSLGLVHWCTQAGTSPEPSCPMNGPRPAFLLIVIPAQQTASPPTSKGLFFQLPRSPPLSCQKLFIKFAKPTDD